MFKWFRKKPEQPRSISDLVLKLEDQVISQREFCVDLQIQFAEALMELQRERPRSDWEFVEERLRALEDKMSKLDGIFNVGVDWDTVTVKRNEITYS